MKLSIPDAALELGVSETRLRKTLTEMVVPTLIEFRRTRTGVRKTTVLGEDAIGLLRAHFEAPLPGAVAVRPESGYAAADSDAGWSARTGAPVCSPIAREEVSACSAASQITTAFAEERETYSPRELRFLGVESRYCDSSAGSGSQEASGSFVSEQAHDPGEPGSAAGLGCRREAPAPPLTGGSVHTVPAQQFNALLYQHNVLREELARVSDYLEGCDRLLGEMVSTISTLEERTRQLERSPGSARGMGNSLSGALRSVSAGVQNALFSRGPRPMLKPTEVYYANVLTGR